ncbi:hypothetical protein [Pontivivens ytuae]|uniref:Uncharacterized protein n=1 Tax=Pontivivens ytuae TaxID=2789856 RepID=A0A7S9LVD3_9RHOB|nr:hypothetical protein [Pontivivens ytuae]QPH56027.1 hypothetical protein I0K15_10020 [Pontivivens ytuae]
MTRFVVPRPPAGTMTSDSETDQFRDRLLKYIPAELVSTFTACVAACAAMGFSEDVVLYILLGVALTFCLLIIFFTKRLFGDQIPNESQRAHRIASNIAFLAWGYSVSGAALPSYYNGGVALLGMALSALAAWLIWPVASSEGD